MLRIFRGRGLSHRFARECDEISTFVVVAPLRPAAREAARELLAEGPPFDLASTALESHQVFLTDREVVFLFEGPDAKENVQKIAGSPDMWRAAARWREVLAGRPRIAESAYVWTRPA
jgi:hypothetical protein